MREGFDIATARAVANLPVLCEYCLPYVRVGGRFVAMKGPSVEEELEAGRRASARLGGKFTSLELKELPGGDRRSFVSFEKISQTPTVYPRNSAKISKLPL